MKNLKTKIILFPHACLNKYFNYRNSKLYYFIWNKLKIKKKSLTFNAEATYLNSMIAAEIKCYSPIQFQPYLFKNKLDEFYHIKEVHRYFDFIPKDNSKHLKIINEREILKLNFLKKIDVAVFSAHCDPKFKKFIKIFKHFNIPICLIDIKDDQTVYKFNEKETKLYFKKKYNEFKSDITLVKDIKKDFKLKKYYPLNICPITRIDKLKFDMISKYDFSFIGNCRPKHMTDRIEIVRLLKQNYKNSYFKVYEQIQDLELTKNEQDTIFKQSKILISPSGIIYDSYRHAGLYKFKKPVLMPRPLIKTTGAKFKDMINCIFYDVKIVNGKTKLINKKKLIKKLNHVLKNEDIQKKIGQNYYKFILRHHTSDARIEFFSKLFEKLKNKKLPNQISH